MQMDLFYRRKPWYAGQFVRKVIPKIKIEGSAVLFFSALLNKQKPRLLSVLVRDVDETFRSAKMRLPVKGGEIDFDFMESFMAELEAQRAAELEAYLAAAGLRDYVLTAEEEAALEDLCGWDWCEYGLEALFGRSTRGKRLKSADRVAGTLPFVTAGEADEGISAYIGNVVDVFPENTTTIDMFGSAKYRNYSYGADDHVAVVHTQALPKMASIFVTAAIHKSSHNGQFDYSKNFYAKNADMLRISLPTKNGAPDYDSMAAFISAVQKLVIKDVVLYADRKLAAAKSVTSKT